MSRRWVALVVVMLLAVVTAACSSDNKVGSDINLKDLKGKGGTRLGETTTTVASVTTAPPTTAKTAVTPKPTTTVAQSIALEIKIQGPSPQFNPSQGAVRSGQTVRWINTDSQARSIQADGGVFVSPSIPPGGHWDLKAPAPGTYNYTDGTRPYAVGTLTVS
jgi:plastocyanin